MAEEITGEMEWREEYYRFLKLNIPQPWRIDYSKLVFERSANRYRIRLDDYRETFNFADVYKASLNGTIVRVEEFQHEFLEEPDNRFDFARVIASLYSIVHPNICTVVGGSEFTDAEIGAYPFIATEYVSRTLEDFLPEIDNYSDKIRLAIGIASGIAYLHSQNRVHGNLTPKQIMVTDDRVAKLTVTIPDILTVYTMNNANGDIVGNIRYCSPERLDPDRFARPERTRELDVYAFGVILWQILFGERLPYADIKRDSDVASFVLDGGRPPFPAEISSPEEFAIVVIITACLDHNYKARPTMETVLYNLSIQPNDIADSKPARAAARSY
jgi:serine/threonine protein kinase